MVYSYLVSFVLLCFAIATHNFDMSFKYLIISAAFAIAGALADRNSNSND